VESYRLTRTWTILLHVPFRHNCVFQESVGRQLARCWEEEGPGRRLKTKRSPSPWYLPGLPNICLRSRLGTTAGVSDRHPSNESLVLFSGLIIRKRRPQSHRGLCADSRTTTTTLFFFLLQSRCRCQYLMLIRPSGPSSRMAYLSLSSYCHVSFSVSRSSPSRCGPTSVSSRVPSDSTTSSWCWDV
jgi:hypothetical protein